MSKPVKKTLVPVLRFPEFRDAGEWVETKLGQLGELVSGLTYSPDDVRDKGLLVLRSSNVQNGAISLADNVYVTPDIRGANLSKPNDILICVRNGSKALIGKNALIPEGMPLCTHGAFMTIFRSPSAKFIFQLFQSSAYQSQVDADLGATINSINGSHFIKYEFYVPRPPEQQKIADCLSSLDALITAHTQKHEALKAHKKGLMQQLFPAEGKTVPTLRFPEFRDAGEWEDNNFYGLLEKIVDFRGRTPKKLGMDWGGGNIVSLSANNVKNGYIDFDAECNLGSLALYEKWMDKVDLKKNDIVFTMEAPLGKALLVPDSQKYILSQRVVAFKTKKNINNAFLIQLIWSQSFQNLIMLLSTGSTAKGINQKTLKTVHVRIPREKKEQQKIADCLSSIDELITAQAKKIESLTTHKKGLMQQLFPAIDDDRMDAKADTVLPKELSHG